MIAQILEDIGICKFSDLPQEAPPLLRNGKHREESAATLEKAANDLELWDRLSTPVYGLRAHSQQEFRDELRKKAQAIRAIGSKSLTHRPSNVLLEEFALYFIETFQKYAGKPLWEFTVGLFALAFERDAPDLNTVKASVRRARMKSAFLGT